MDKLLISLFLILSITLSSAACSEGQIDVNAASLSELDEIYGIGPAKAQAIIDARPYETLDDLVNAYGIGPVVLQNIKAQDLACVAEKDTDSQETEKSSSEEAPPENSQESEEQQETSQEFEETEATQDIEDSKDHIPLTEITTENNPSTENSENPSTNTLKQEILLNPETSTKDIKTSKNSKLQEDKKYSIYALIIFCIFLGFLFILDKKKNSKKQNEFRKFKD